MSEDLPKKEKSEERDILDLGRVSEIARTALKNLVTSQKPAVPPFYEKAFYHAASDMGEDEMIAHLLSSLPTGQAATIMVEGVSSMISNLNSDIRIYRQGLDQHGGQLKNKHDHIRSLVDMEVWKLLEKDFDELRGANQAMKKQLATAQQRLACQEQQVVTLQRKTRSDPLTGVMNRLAMEEDLPDEFARSNRYGRTFGLVMADIDFFKKVNDTYGHGIGDEALRAFAQIMRNCLRDVDVIYRYGGEEFVIVMPETDSSGAMAAAERLRSKVEGQVLKQKDNPDLQLRFTASFGVSGFLKGDRDYQEVLKRADMALYQAKDNGRNRVESNFGVA